MCVCVCVCVVVLGEVCEDGCAFLGGQFVLLVARLLQELLPHDGEDGAQQRASEPLSRLVARQAVTELRDVTVAQPPAKNTHTHTHTNTHTHTHTLEHRSCFSMPKYVHSRVCDLTDART